ncbi:MAG: DinB family protein [Vicinamibacterales bacterium]
MSNRTFFQQTLSSEFDRFHNVIAALPAGRLDFRHDPKSRSAAELVGHVIGHIQDMIELIDEGVIHHRMQVPFADLKDALQTFDDGCRTLDGKLRGADDATWAKTADFLVGEQSIMKAPVEALMWMLFLDAVHHRGQLSTCIRPMGGKVPAIYGPSADTAMAH